MPRRVDTWVAHKSHRRDSSNDPRACGPCGQPSHLTPNTVASTAFAFAHFAQHDRRGRWLFKSLRDTTLAGCCRGRLFYQR
jgi:hypothetical protein